MINIVLIFLIALVLFWGIYKLLIALNKIPDRKCTKALYEAFKDKNTKKKIENSALMPIAKKVAPIIIMNEFKKEQLKDDLKRLNIPIKPEVYIAYTLVQSLLIGIFSIPFFIIGWGGIGAIIAVLAVIAFFMGKKSDSKKIIRINEQIQNELPQLAESLNSTLGSSRDILSFFKRHRRMVRDCLKKDLDILVFEMQSGSHIKALENLSKRIRMPEISQLVNILINIVQGINQNNALSEYANNVRTLMHERFRQELQARSLKSYPALMIIVISFTLIIAVPMGLIVFENLQMI